MATLIATSFIGTEMGQNLQNLNIWVKIDKQPSIKLYVNT